MFQIPIKRVFSFLLILVFGCLIARESFSEESVVIEKSLTQKKNLKEDTFVKILAIDGGGIRGIIPAIILKEVESRLKNKKHLSQCFDVMSGTSTGGIIILLLNVPNENNSPKSKMDDIVNLYQNLGSEVFYNPLWHRLITLNGWLSEKYYGKNFTKNMEKYFGNTQLKDSLTEVIIPAYDIKQDHTIFFKSSYAKQDNSRNFYFKDIARATSAAPTYFKPVNINDLSGKNTYNLIDGGISVNNPSLSASIHALKTFSKYKIFLIVSIGTGISNDINEGTISFGKINIKTGGKIAWADDIVSVMLHARNDIVDYLLENAFVPDKIKKYYRFQASLSPKHESIDDVSRNNIETLKDYAHDLIKKHDSEINHIVQILDN